MKYKLLKISLLGIFAMLAGLWGNGAWAADRWVKTDPANLQSGNVVAIVDQTSSMAMSNDKGASAAPVATAVTLSDDKSEITSTVGATLQWVVTVTGDTTKTYQFYVAGTENYLYVTKTNNGLRVGSGERNTFTIVTGGDHNGYYLFNAITDDNRYVGCYNTADWRCYTTINTNIKVNDNAFYKLVKDESDTRVDTSITFGEHATTGEAGTSIDLPTATVKAGETTVSNATVTWSSSKEECAVINGNKINLLAAGKTTITATYAGDDTNYKGSTNSYELTVIAAPYSSIAAMLADITATRTTATYQFENLLVTYVNGSNTFVSDGQNGFLFYGSELGLVAGNTYTGTATGQIYTYNGLPEMALTANDISAQVVSEGNSVAWTAIAPADLQNNINVPVTIEDAVFVEAGTGKNLAFKVGETDLAVYNNWSIDVSALEADKTYTLTGIGAVYSKNETTTYQIYLVSFEEKAAEEPAGFRDIKADLTQLQALATGSNVYITVAEDGTISQTDNAEAAAATLKGNWHGTSYGWSNFTASVPVEGCVKITYATHDFGNDIVVTNADGEQVAKLNTTGAKWMNNHDNVVVAYYRTNEPTTLNFSNANYNPYFAVEAIDEADLPACRGDRLQRYLRRR